MSRHVDKCLAMPMRRTFQAEELAVAGATSCGLVCLLTPRSLSVCAPTFAQKRYRCLRLELDHGHVDDLRRVL